MQRNILFISVHLSATHYKCVLSSISTEGILLRHILNGQYLTLRLSVIRPVSFMFWHTTAKCGELYATGDSCHPEPCPHNLSSCILCLTTSLSRDMEMKLPVACSHTVIQVSWFPFHCWKQQYILLQLLMRPYVLLLLIELRSSVLDAGTECMVFMRWRDLAESQTLRKCQTSNTLLYSTLRDRKEILYTC